MSIDDVLVLPEDWTVLERCRFKPESIDDAVIEIAEYILEDSQGYQLQNQIDDAENFKMHGEPYNTRIYFILAACRLLWDEAMVRKAVLEFFTVQNTPMGVKSDGQGNYDAEDFDEYVTRMTKAVMTSPDVDKVCEYLFNYYMNKPIWSDPNYSKMQKLTRMRILRGRKLDMDYNHSTVELVVPKAKVKEPSAMDWEGKEVDVGKELVDSKDRLDPTTERWMHCEEDEKELDEAMKDWLHTKFY
jgi:hypothetical protein